MIYISYSMLWLSHYRLTNPEHVMLSKAKHLCHGVRDPSVAEKRFLTSSRCPSGG